MYKKFAMLTLMEDLSEVAAQSDYMRHDPKLDINEYIESYNPFICIEKRLVGEYGYEIRLPLTADDFQGDEQRKKKQNLYYAKPFRR